MWLHWSHATYRLEALPPFCGSGIGECGGGREDMTFYADMENGFLLLLFDMIYLASEYRIKKIQEREPNHSDFKISI